MAKWSGFPSAEDIPALLQSPEYQKAVAERRALMEQEASYLEDAPWFGRTGLGDALERELPRYLRREFGESVFEEGALKASELDYLGVYHDGGLLVHFWRVPSSVESTFATVTVGPEGVVTSWGSDAPPGR